MIGDKFFFVDVKNMEQAVYSCKTNSYEKNYQVVGRKSANEIFTLNDVPFEYQKLVLRSRMLKKLKFRMNDNAMAKQNNYYAEEYISNFVFCEVVQPGKSDKVSLINAPFYDEASKQWFFNYISCNTVINNISRSSVIDFFTELKQKNLLESYLKSLSELFMLNKKSIDLINGRSDDFKNDGYQKVLK
jgi:hypothetical protein